MSKAPAGRPKPGLRTLQTLLQSGRADDAWAAARNELARRPRDPAVLNLAGIAAFQAGEPAIALDLLTDAAHRRPGDAEIQMNLGNVQAAVGATEAALAAYDAAHALAKGFAEPAYNAGMLLNRLGRYRDAADKFAAALGRDPDHGAATLGRAEALRLAGDLQGALDELTGLAQRRPDDARALTNLAAVYSALGRHDDAAAAAARAAKADPGLAEAHYNLGTARLALGDAAAASEALRRALALQPDNAAAALNLGEAELIGGHGESARRAFARALEIDPSFAKAAINLADIDLAAGDARAAVAAIDRFLARVPGQPAALAFKALALRDCGEAAAAAEIDDVARFAEAAPIAVPGGYADLAAFNRALAEHLLAHPTLTPSPEAHATRLGRHSGELLDGDAGPVADLAEIVMQGFRRYRRRFAGTPSHPFLDRCPAEVRLSVWGVVMQEGGHQVAHIHPSAWLSGVYYVEVPPTVRPDDVGQAGWIEFGRAPDDIHTKAAPAVTTFRPEPGLMILFPSHFYHRTIPLAGTQRRISIAFDILPR